MSGVRHRTRSVLLAALAVLSGAAAANAQSALHWNGPYAGGHIGFGWGTAALAFPAAPASVSTTTTTNQCKFGKAAGVPQATPPPGSLFKSLATGNQSYPAAVAAILGLTPIGGGYYQATTPVGFDFRSSTGFADAGCIGHQVYWLAPDGRYYGGRQGVPIFPIAGFPADFVPSDSNGNLLTTESTTTPTTTLDLGPFNAAKLDQATLAALAAIPGTTAEIGISGVFGGVHAGYNYLITPSILIGFETDLAIAAINGSRSFGLAEIEAGIDWFGTLRGRLGTVSGNWLVYLTAGLAYGDNHVRYSVGDFNVTDRHVRIGWTAGGGVEIALDRETTLKGEYKYVDFGEASYPGGSTLDVRGHFELHTIVVGIAKRF